MAAGIMVDTAGLFSISINFASIIYGRRQGTLLFEDKLAQVSTLLAVDGPVALLLMSYAIVRRRKFRIVLIATDVLMTVPWNRLLQSRYLDLLCVGRQIRVEFQLSCNRQSHLGGTDSTIHLLAES